MFIPLPQRGEIHLWVASLPSDLSCSAQAMRLLSGDEQARAARYRVPQARHQFVVTRGGLRVLLGTYLQCPPQGVEFTYSRHGKPSLVEAEAASGLVFNVSHSHHHVLYAVGRQDALGVDLQWVDPAIATMRLAHRLCTPTEWDTLVQQPSPGQQQRVFRLWTRKEAVIKLWGDRLFARLSTLTVPLDPLPDGAWLLVNGQQLWLQDLKLGNGFVGAIAASAPIQTLHYRTGEHLGLCDGSLIIKA